MVISKKTIICQDSRESLIFQGGGEGQPFREGRGWCGYSNDYS